MSFARARLLVAYAGMAVVFGALVRRAAMPLDNRDTYFHLRFGHEFLSGDWSLRDPGSVSTLATADWVPTQWLSEVVMAQTEDWFGLAGVAWLSGLLFLSLALVVYWACRRQAEPSVAALLVVLTLIACTSGISMRPQLVSYVLVVVTAAAWLRARDTGRAPWLLVPVTWVWTMCHGMWPVGIVIGVVAVLGLALDRGHPRRTLARMAAVPVLSAAVSLLTPAGPGLFAAVLRVGSRAKYFYEWDPPDYTKPWVATLAVILALAVVPRLRRAERVPWFDRPAARARGAVGGLLDAHRAGGGLPGRAARRGRPAAGPRRAAVGAPARAAARRRRLRGRAGHARPGGAAHRGRATATRRRGSTARSATCPRAPGSSTTAASAAT